jgi:hypothetical protein
VKESLERANASIYPTVRLGAAHGRLLVSAWRPDEGPRALGAARPEDAALDALARLSAAGDLLLGDQTKFAGMFRAHGLLVPVWDIPGEPDAAEWEAPLADFAKRYADTLAETGPLDAAGPPCQAGPGRSPADAAVTVH